MEEILASDSHFLLGNWINDAKNKGTNRAELDLYEFNARLQVTLWGTNETQSLFDYACKAWSGLLIE
jgi:alpha-N-acetylglucosaminidase